MAAENFGAALARVLVHEGTFSNHPKDPGGVTLEGITQRVNDSYRRRKGLPPRPLTRQLLNTPEWNAERDAIYRRQYWDVIKGDQLPPGIDYVVFDGAVNSGPVQSVKWLQRALGVRADGMVGEVTLSALDAHPDHDAIVREICERRLSFLRALKTWSTFGKGWSRRVSDVEQGGYAWARGSVPAFVGHIPGANAKATLADAKDPPSTGPASVTSGGGAITTALSQAQTAIEPHTGTSEAMAYVYAALTVAGLLATVGGIAWVMWARNRRAALEDALDLRTDYGPGAGAESFA